MARGGLVGIEGLEGARDVKRRFGKLKLAVKRRVLRKGVAAATKPVAKAAKRHAPRETGTLRKSIGRVTRTYRNSGVTAGFVGPRRGFGREVVIDGEAQFRDPVKYAHLVEHGTARTRPNPFLRPAFDSTKGQSAKEAADKVREEIAKEARRAR